MPLLWSLQATAVTPEEMQEVRQQFRGGLSSEQANQETYNMLHYMLEKEPDNPLLLVYFGSTETLKGRYAWMPWSKLGYVNDGLAHIERALRLAEQQEVANSPLMILAKYEVQLVAARTYVALPDMFNTFDSGKQLLDKLLEEEARNQWPNNFRASLYSAAARAAEHDGDVEAQAQWQQRADALNEEKKGESQS